MKIHFALGWMEKPGKLGFKLSAYEILFKEYVSRISKFNSCATGKIEAKPAGAKLWLCHTSKKAKLMSSEDLAKALQNLQNSGVKELIVAIGPADGFKEADVEKFHPDLLWSFGPATYPHELAAVMAAEQVYRAHSIIHRLPYHTGH